MKFQPFHKLFFNAKEGAFSRVTEREFYDSQITLTDIEADIVINYFRVENIQFGNVKSNPKKAIKKFKLYGEVDSDVFLNLVYPKSNKKELRLYTSKKAGFKPEAGLIWFLYIDQQDILNIGALEESIWNDLGQVDEEDNDYLEKVGSLLIPKLVFPKSIKGKIQQVEVKGRLTFKRNPILAALRFQAADYKCEIDSNHKTFTSIKTMMPFVEAHHFIPMKYQSVFKEPLDSFENIISLCPNCHRGFHHAITSEKIELIKNIYDKRPMLLERSFEEIAGYYNCVNF